MAENEDYKNKKILNIFSVKKWLRLYQSFDYTIIIAQLYEKKNREVLI